MEDPADIAFMVADILNAATDADLPECLAEVVRIRSAARRVIEAEIPWEDKQRLVSSLASLAVRSEVPFMATQALEAEIRPDEEGVMPARSWERRQQQLRRIGYSSCPCCLSAVATAGELDRYEALRRQAVEERERRDSVPLVQGAHA